MAKPMTFAIFSLELHESSAGHCLDSVIFGIFRPRISEKFWKRNDLCYATKTQVNLLGINCIIINKFEYIDVTMFEFLFRIIHIV